MHRFSESCRSAQHQHARVAIKVRLARQNLDQEARIPPPPPAAEVAREGAMAISRGCQKTRARFGALRLQPSIQNALKPASQSKFCSSWSALEPGNRKRLRYPGHGVQCRGLALPGIALLCTIGPCSIPHHTSTSPGKLCRASRPVHRPVLLQPSPRICWLQHVPVLMPCPNYFTMFTAMMRGCWRIHHH